ncbi:MAG: hypothetical protein ACKVHE_32085 [Planctomycetales bacterium]
MFKAMLRKESVVVAGPLLLAVVALSVLVGDAVYESRRRPAPQGDWMLDGDLVYPFLMGSVCLAMTIGVLQCVTEETQGTWRYAHAFPGGWRQILKLKLACGAVTWIVWSGMAISICLLGIGLDKGSEGEPLGKLFDPMLRTLVSVPIVYFGGYLTALRPARWYATRLLPGLGVVPCWFLVLYLPSWWVVAPLVTVAFSALLIGVIFHIAETRDFA